METSGRDLYCVSCNKHVKNNRVYRVGDIIDCPLCGERAEVTKWDEGQQTSSHSEAVMLSKKPDDTGRRKPPVQWPRLMIGCGTVGAVLVLCFLASVLLSQLPAAVDAAASGTAVLIADLGTDLLLFFQTLLYFSAALLVAVVALIAFLALAGWFAASFLPSVSTADRLRTASRQYDKQRKRSESIHDPVQQGMERQSQEHTFFEDVRSAYHLPQPSSNADVLRETLRRGEHAVQRQRYLIGGLIIGIALGVLVCMFEAKSLSTLGKLFTQLAALNSFSVLIFAFLFYTGKMLLETQRLKNHVNLTKRTLASASYAAATLTTMVVFQVLSDTSVLNTGTIAMAVASNVIFDVIVGIYGSAIMRLLYSLRSKLSMPMSSRPRHLST
jgi:hypothetical protein